jgi:hypothetical protein
MHHIQLQEIIAVCYAFYTHIIKLSTFFITLMTANTLNYAEFFRKTTLITLFQKRPNQVRGTETEVAGKEGQWCFHKNFI